MAHTHCRNNGGHTASDSALSLLQLPAEHRDAIYRTVFDDITSTARNTSIWSKRLAKCRLSSYLALILTCRQVQYEASLIFEREYLQNLVWYFDDLHEFYQFTVSALSSNIRSTSASFVLKTPVVTATSHGVSTMIMKVIQLLQGPKVVQNPLPPGFVEAFFELEEDPRSVAEAKSWVSMDGSALEAHYENGFLFRTATYSTTAPGTIRMKMHRKSVDGAEDDIITISGHLRDVEWKGVRCNTEEAQKLKCLMMQWTTMRQELTPQLTAVDKALVNRQKEEGPHSGSRMESRGPRGPCLRGIAEEDYQMLHKSKVLDWMARQQGVQHR